MSNIIKPILFIAIFSFCVYVVSAQTNKDTIVTKKNAKIIGKITKVTETDIEYKKGDEQDAPVYVIGREKVRELRFANGNIENIAFDEMDINKEIQIIDKRSDVKLHFFSPMYHYLAFGYERCIKVGTNIEGSIGYIDNSAFNLNTSTRTNYSYYNRTPLIRGGMIRVGPKFLLGEDYYMKGMKYAHPMKGRYFKPEIILTAFSVIGLQRNVYSYPYYNYSTVTSDLKVTAVTVMLNYGRQLILGNIMTFGYSIGCGYAFVNDTYTNPSFNSGNYYSEDNAYTENLFTHLRVGNTPLAVNGTITLGYIFK